VGLDVPDDAGVYRLADDMAIIQSVDYFTPVVDDPYDFGQVAAANALSDIYAMGGRPLTVLNLAGFPIGQLPTEVFGQILRGSSDKVKEAGAVLLGGHSVDDAELKFGLSVTGIIHPHDILRNSTARAGDVIVLTKPIGTGIASTALKHGLLPPDQEKYMVTVMARLNNLVEEMRAAGVHACTDVTGFGLLGHAAEMAAASGVCLRFHARQVPMLPDIFAYLEENQVPAGTRRNERYVSKVAEFSPDLEPGWSTVLSDAVTSGGLLVTLPEERVAGFLTSVRAKAPWATVVGRVEAGPAGCLVVEP